MIHKPVLLKETIEYLNLKEGMTVVDATIDGGGHAREILKIIGPRGKLFGIDQDDGMIQRLKDEGLGENLFLINGNFKDLDKLVPEKVDAILFDLGLSSLQLEESGRGFSFKKDEPLIMTFKQNLGPDDLTAQEILNNWSERDIGEIIFRYGEERYAKRIARGIVERRNVNPIMTTTELVEIIRKSVPFWYRNQSRQGKINCATKTFQALRIAVNDELKSLKEGLESGLNILAPNGRMAVISFHSLEDRIVKNFIKEKVANGEVNNLTKKPITPQEQERLENPRSRSAKLRVIQRLI